VTAAFGRRDESDDMPVDFAENRIAQSRYKLKFLGDGLIALGTTMMIDHLSWPLLTSLKETILDRL
jgi:hypothetical protein